MSSKSKAKGNRGEKRIVDIFNTSNFSARRTPLSGALGGEYAGDVWITGVTQRRLVAEVKSRKSSLVFWKKINNYFEGNDLLFLLEDRQEPLVVLSTETFLEILNENIERRT